MVAGADRMPVRLDVVGIAAFAPLRCGRREKSEDTKRQTISEGAGKGGVILQDGSK